MNEFFTSANYVLLLFKTFNDNWSYFSVEFCGQNVLAFIETLSRLILGSGINIGLYFWVWKLGSSVGGTSFVIQTDHWSLMSVLD